MNNEVYGIVTRQDITVWITKEEAVKLSAMLVDGKKFVIIRDRVINTADITGIYKGEDIRDKNMQKRGLWKGNNGKFYTRKEEFWRECYLPSFEELQKELPEVSDKKALNEQN